MPRSPTDATRFTSTGPYASTKPSSTPSSSTPPQPIASASSSPSSTSNLLNFNAAPAPPNETPQQKIARLRAAARQARLASETPFDKTVRIGRRIADRAHRITAMSLIALTLGATVFAVGGITDMIMHNRRRRSDWLAEKQAQSARDLFLARQAEASGQATEDQILLINRARAAAEAEAERQNRPGVFKRATGWLFSDLEKEEKKGGKLGIVEKLTETTESLADEGRSVMRTVEDKMDRRPMGGPLDQQAQLVTDSVSSRARGWTSWVTGR